MGPVNVLKCSTCGGRTRAQIKLKDVVQKARFENELRNWWQWKGLSSISIRFASNKQKGHANWIRICRHVNGKHVNRSQPTILLILYPVLFVSTRLEFPPISVSFVHS